MSFIKRLRIADLDRNLILTIISVIAAAISAVASISASNQMSEQNALVRQSVTSNIDIAVKKLFNIKYSRCALTSSESNYIQESLYLLRVTNNGGAATSMLGFGKNEFDLQPPRRDRTFRFLSRNEYDEYVINADFDGNFTLTYGFPPILITEHTTYYIPVLSKIILSWPPYSAKLRYELAWENPQLLDYGGLSHVETESYTQLRFSD